MFSSNIILICLLLDIIAATDKVQLTEVKDFHCNTTLKRYEINDVISESTKNVTENTEATWSTCSASCGRGIQRRICETDDTKQYCDATETRPCFLQFCPSYLSSPRFHFSGSFIADVSTVNNVRCNYVNSKFTPASMKENFPIPSKKGDGYVVETRSWNPDGSGRFHLNAHVMSLCTSPGNCTTDDEIVGKEMKETTVVAMVDVDPDWQLASEIYGMRIKIQGILEAKFQTSAIQQPKPRGNYVMAAMKSKLVDITWTSDVYKTLFRNSTSLSISMVMDQFVERTRRGRITGTIGLTSEDDPLSTTAVRRMYPTGGWKMKGSVPFHINAHDKFITVDLSSAFNCSEDGRFDITTLGEIDLAIDLGQDVFCRGNQRLYCKKSSPANLRYITRRGGISRQMDNDNRWYEGAGGVLDVDISHVPDDVIQLMTSHKIAIMLRKKGEKIPRAILSETEHGISLGFMDHHVRRLNPGESFETKAFVSSFGKPLQDVEIQMGIVKNSMADMDCGWSNCNRTLSEPSNALQITGLEPSNEQGLVTFNVLAREPGNVRGCELDGQIFPTDLRTKLGGLTYVEGGLLRQEAAEKDYDYYLATTPSVVAVYNEVPEIECPTWHDIKDIFIRYHNLYPVMWKNNIIDLSSYNDVKQRSRMLKYAMFEVDFEDPRFMPINRDLSKSKTKLIKNWMECGMKERNEPEYPTCHPKDIHTRIGELKELLQRAVTLELSIIPPYYTAWLSLQTEYGRNQETAGILRSVFVDEMLHMTLAANILNAVNGTVNLTTFSALPLYPTQVGFGENYKLAPNLVMTLGPLSRGLISDVFMPIEGPVDKDQRKILGDMTKLLQKLGESSVSTATKQFTSSHTNDERTMKLNITTEKPKLQSLSGSEDEKYDFKNTETAPIDWNEINKFTSQAIFDISNTEITSIGAFYTLIGLNLAFVESCFQMEADTKTFFSGNRSHQLNIIHWHKPEDFYLEDSDTEDFDLPVFEVKDLRSALQAIVAIIFEGEGGTSCSPYLKEEETSMDLPHYYRFMEIVHGRKLTKVREPASWEMNSCLNLENDCDASDNFTNETMLCFTGDNVPFFEDGVWPIIMNPEESMYTSGSEVKNLNKEFNHLYTRLLKCLETSFGGKPDHVRQCMQEMHYMRIVGKKIVQTPVYKNGVKVGHGTPTWVYQRDENETSGLPITNPLKELY